MHLLFISKNKTLYDDIVQFEIKIVSNPNERNENDDDDKLLGPFT